MKRKHRRRPDIVRIIDQVTTQISINDERRVVESFSNRCPHREMIPWIRSVRHANQEEESRKIDIVFLTIDAGEINLQIKSSTEGVERFCKEQMNGKADMGIICLVINPGMDHEMIFRKLLPILSWERRARLKRRRFSMSAEGKENTT